MTRTKSRFLSIFGIVALGVGFFTGITNSAPDMRLTAQNYYKTNNLAHFRLVSTLGFSDSDIAALEALDSGKYGVVLRAKGIVPTADGTWIHFDHVPGEVDVRTGPAAVTGKLCVIGSGLDEAGIAALFGV